MPCTAWAVSQRWLRTVPNRSSRSACPFRLTIDKESTSSRRGSSPVVSVSRTSNFLDLGQSIRPPFSIASRVSTAYHVESRMRCLQVATRREPSWKQGHPYGGLLRIGRFRARRAILLYLVRPDRSGVSLMVERVSAGSHFICTCLIPQVLLDICGINGCPKERAPCLYRLSAETPAAPAGWHASSRAFTTSARRPHHFRACHAEKAASRWTISRAKPDCRFAQR